jgi:putative membrane protein insertion efficiency factor
MKKILIGLLKFYKIVVSPLLELLFGKGCRYTPTCSEYAMEAIEKYGVIKGGKLAAVRISKCHPFSKGNFDPVPKL